MKRTKRVLEQRNWEANPGQASKVCCGCREKSLAELAFIISPKQDQSVPHPGGSIPVSIYLPWELTVQVSWEKSTGTPSPPDPESESQWRRVGRPLGGGGAKARVHSQDRAES